MRISAWTLNKASFIYDPKRPPTRKECAAALRMVLIYRDTSAAELGAVVREPAHTAENYLKSNPLPEEYFQKVADFLGLPTPAKLFAEAERIRLELLEQHPAARKTKTVLGK